MPSMLPNPMTEHVVRDLITEAADRHQIPRRVALAFAWLESRFRVNAVGDLDWATRDDGRRYRAHVLADPRLKSNPARDDPAAWCSYGLFQLLAAYHVEPHEHPRELLDPRRNADRGCAFIRRLLQRTKGDVQQARWVYLGLSVEDAKHAQAREEASKKLRAALRLFSMLTDEKEPSA